MTNWKKSEILKTEQVNFRFSICSLVCFWTFLEYWKIKRHRHHSQIIVGFKKITLLNIVKKNNIQLLYIQCTQRTFTFGISNNVLVLYSSFLHFSDEVQISRVLRQQIISWTCVTSTLFLRIQGYCWSIHTWIL